MLPWSYSCLLNVIQEMHFAVPDKPVGCWTVAECKDFLHCRHLNPSGRVAELRHCVTENRDMPVPPPAGGSLVMTQSMIYALWMMLCHQMGVRSATVKQCSVAERLIRIFLTTCCDYDKWMNDAVP